MTIRIIAFGIAKDILRQKELDFELNEQASLADLKTELQHQYPDFEQLVSLRFAVGEEYQSDDFILSPQTEVVIIPPVAGG